MRKKVSIVIIFIALVGGWLYYVNFASPFIVESQINSKYGSLSQEELANITIPWTWKDLLKNPGNYYNEIIYVKGHAENVEGSDFQQIAIRANDGRDYVVIKHAGERIFEGDFLISYGVLESGETIGPDRDPAPIIKSVFLITGDEAMKISGQKCQENKIYCGNR